MKNLNSGLIYIPKAFADHAHEMIIEAQSMSNLSNNLFGDNQDWRTVILEIQKAVAKTNERAQSRFGISKETA